jgi:hypothetical protein
MSKTIRAVSYASAVASAMAMAVPSQAQLTKADRVGTALMVPATTTASGGTSASAGTSATDATSAPSSFLIDRSPPDREVVIAPGTRPAFLNVDWGDTVQFLVRQPSGGDRIVKWRFDGVDNVVSFADIDPAADFAGNYRIFVNQSTNPMRSNPGSD